MLNIDSLSVKDILLSIAKAEFWYGGILIGGIIYWGLSTYENMNRSHINLQHEMTISKTDNKVQLLELELIQLKSDLSKLQEKNSQLELANKDILERKRKFLKVVSNHCSEQVRLIKTLQKDHQLQIKFDMNYEYRSILEKVIITMFENAESCQKATNV